MRTDSAVMEMARSTCPGLMAAVVVSDGRAQLKHVPLPVVGDDEVMIRVKCAGVCRTDISLATGQRAAGRNPLILGHELAGDVVETGDRVRDVASGMRVTVMPSLPCGKCRECQGGIPSACQARTMLGCDVDGAFAEYVCVNQRAVHALPDSVTDREGAYAEPVAAALAVLDAGIEPGQRGLVYGGGRIAELTYRVLLVHDFVHVDIGRPHREDGAYDFVIDTSQEQRALDDVLRLVRPRGAVIVKSRARGAVPVNTGAIVEKELSLRGAHYGRFADALALIADGALELCDLMGPVHPLDAYEEVFRRERSGEDRKQFFAPKGGLSCAAL